MFLFAPFYRLLAIAGLGFTNSFDLLKNNSLDKPNS